MDSFELSSGCRDVRAAAGRFWNDRGFTLVELLVVVAIIAVLALIAFPLFGRIVDNAKVSRCATEVRNLEKDITGYLVEKGVLPDSLNDIGRGSLKDPWGHNYQYANLANGDPARESFGVALNTDFDVFSLGSDGVSQADIFAAESMDDVVRSGDGGWVGLGKHF